MEVLRVEGVSKKFSRTEVLKDVSFSLGEGEIVTLVGPNGSGKTTLMKAICDLMTIDKGKILVNGIEAKTDRVAYVSNLSCIIESPALYDMLTGYQNINLIAKLNRIPQKEVEEALEFIGIGKAIHRKVKGYSLGMKQRLALGMALIQNPKLIVLDEPTNGLDLTGVLEFRKLIRRLKQEKKLSILISTHIVSDIESLSDRLLFLKDGGLYTLDSMDIDWNQTRIILTVENQQLTAEQLQAIGGFEDLSLLDEDKIKISINHQELATYIKQLVTHDIQYQDLQVLNKSFEEIYQDFYA